MNIDKTNYYQELYGDLDKCILPDEEITELIIEYKNTKSKEVKEKILKSHLKMIIGIVEKYNTYGSIDKEDLIHAGVIGFLDALESYDESRQVKLSYYSYLYIKEKIIKEIESCIYPVSISSYYKKKSCNYKKLYRKWTKECVEFTDEEICKELDISPKTFKIIKEIATMTSISYDCVLQGSPIENTSSESLLPENEVTLRNNVILLYETIYNSDLLTEKEKDVIINLFDICEDEPKSIKELAAKYNVSDARICQIKSNALEKLKNNLKDKLY